MSSCQKSSQSAVFGYIGEVSPRPDANRLCWQLLKNYGGAHDCISYNEQRKDDSVAEAEPMRCDLTVLHPWSSWRLWSAVGWTVRWERPVPDPDLGPDPGPEPGCVLPRLPPRQLRRGCCRARGSERAEASAGRSAWASAAWRTAWPESRVSARSASRRPEASPLVRSGCTPPGRSHRGQGTGRRWTCLQVERRRADYEEC